MDEIQARLERLVDQRPYVFRDTPKEVAEQFLRDQRALIGLSEGEVADLEESLGVNFPHDFRSFLLRMGERSGRLFQGSYARAENYAEYRAYLEELIEDEGVPSFLTPYTVVFLMNEGYRFSFIEADNAEYSTVWTYGEGDDGPTQLATSFEEYLHTLLVDIEHTQAEISANGGYYLTVRAHGRTQPVHPDPSDGRRPMDEGDVWP